MPYRPDARKGAFVVALLLVTVTLVGSSFTVYHFLVHPLVTPRFGGVIVYIDSLNADVQGHYTVRLDGCIIETEAFFGQGGKQIVLEEPEGGGVWSVYVIAKSHGRIRLRVVDGVTRQLLEEGHPLSGDGDGTPKKVLVDLTYSRVVSGPP